MPRCIYARKEDSCTELEERKNDEGRFDGEEASQGGIVRGILVHDR